MSRFARFAFSDEVGDGVVAVEDFHGDDAAVGVFSGGSFWQTMYRSPSESWLRTSSWRIGGEEVEDAGQGSGDVAGVEGGEDEVAGFGGGQNERDVAASRISPQR